MSAPKLVTIHGMLGKLESSYNGGGSLSTSTDGLWLQEPFIAAPDYLHSGERGLGPGTGGQVPDAPAKGRFIQGAPRIEARGAGAAYSQGSSVFARDLHAALKAAGHSHLVSGGAGSEQCLYKPSSVRTDWGSIVASFYAYDELFGVTGWYNNFQFEIADGGPMVCTFPGKGVLAMPTDAAVPAITYQNPDTQPPRAESLAVAVGSFANVPVRRIQHDLGRVVGNPRTNLSVSGALSGFSLGRYAPILTLTMEANALVGSPFHSSAGIHPYELKERKTQLAVSFGFGTGGTGNYNRLEFSAPKAQIRSVAPETGDPEALWRVQLLLSTPAGSADDAYSLITK